jgi:signal transduction histidine kinase
MLKKFTLLFLITITFYTADGQEGNLQLYQNGYYIRQYSEYSGLVSNNGRKLFEDSKGMLWVGTFKGLSRFDGNKFVNFGIREGLPGTSINQVCEDSLGFIYVATTMGIARYTGYNKSTGSYFYVYPQTRGGKLPINGMQAIDSNTILFQYPNGVVCLLKNNILTQLSGPSSDNQGGSVILHDHYKYYYAYVRDTFRVFDARFNLVENIFNKDSEFSGEVNDENGQVHVYYNGTLRKVAGGKIMQVSQVPDSIIWFDCMDPRDKLAYFQGGAVWVYDKGSSQKILDLTSISLTCKNMLVTRDNSIWVSTNVGGVFHITPLSYTSDNAKTDGSHYYYYKEGKRLISSNRLNDPAASPVGKDGLKIRAESVLTDSKGITWHCTVNGVYKSEPGKKPVLYTFPGKKNFWNEHANRVVDALETSNGDICFLGVFGAAIYHNGEFKLFNSGHGIAIPIGERMLYGETEQDGSVLLMNYFNQLYCIQGDSIFLVRNPVGIPDFSPGRIKKDTDGNIWTDYDKRLYKLRKQGPGKYIITDSIVPLAHQAEYDIKAFNFDLRGNCWVGYAGGKIQVFFREQNGHYSTANSIAYTKDDGLNAVTSTSYSLCADASGNMVLIPPGSNMGTVFSFSSVDAEKRKNSAFPHVSVTDIFINYETGPSGIPSTFKLDYSDNTIAFNYAGTSLSHPGSVLFQTTLEGFDNKWQTTSATTAYYTNLPPGSYHFHVRASNPNGQWSEIRSYDFTILPPWYRTWWAIILWVLFFFFLRLNAVRMHNLKESNLFKTSLIGLIGHDMMTPLRYIAKVSMQLRNYNGRLSHETTIDSLSDINSTATQLHFFGESIIHWIKTQNSEFSPIMEIFHLNRTVAELVEFHHPLAEEKGNEISYEIDGNIFCYQDPTLVRIILHNLLLNSNKFTNNGQIIITAEMETDWLVISVKDNGNGMSPEKAAALNNLQPINSSNGTRQEKGWGLGYKVIIDLLKFSKGTMQIASQLNEGTEVVIKLPSEINQNGHPAGGFLTGVNHIYN